MDSKIGLHPIQGYVSGLFTEVIDYLMEVIIFIDSNKHVSGAMRKFPTAIHPLGLPVPFIRIAVRPFELSIAVFDAIAKSSMINGFVWKNAETLSTALISIPFSFVFAEEIVVGSAKKLNTDAMAHSFEVRISRRVHRRLFLLWIERLLRIFRVES